MLIAQEIVYRVIDGRPSIAPQRDINQNPVTLAPINKTNVQTTYKKRTTYGPHPDLSVVNIYHPSPSDVITPKGVFRVCYVPLFLLLYADTHHAVCSCMK